MTVIQNYSGVIINENKAPSTKVKLGSSWTTQNVFKPGGLIYGIAPNQKYPELSGFQILCETSNIKTNFLYNFSYNQSEVGQVTIFEGEQTKVASSGERIWTTVYFPEPISTIPYKEESIYFVISIKKAPTDPVEYIWKNEVSLNYRLLGLTADHGTDFLGNPYRSLVEVAT